MLKPEPAPLECFGLSYSKTDPMCKACEHRVKCLENMGLRAERIAIGEAKFCLVPEEYVRRHEEPDADRRDIDAIYTECFKQVYGSEKGRITTVGAFRERVFKGATAAKLNIRDFILINMFGYSVAYPEKTFTPSLLADGRAVYRASVYADACRERYGAVNTLLMDASFGSDLTDYDLGKRMLTSEVKAATWIIDYKLWHHGLPYEPMFEDLQNTLDPAWLAVEKHYDETLQYYSQREAQPDDTEILQTRHQAVMIYKRLKKYDHEAIAYFMARERIMPGAVRQVIAAYGYTDTDFEITDKPISDPLLFWNRLGVALQHLECLLFVNYGEGIYARK